VCVTTREVDFVPSKKMKDTSLRTFQRSGPRSVGVNVLMSVFETRNGEAEGQTPGFQENTEGFGKLLINAGTETFLSPNINGKK